MAYVKRELVDDVTPLDKDLVGHMQDGIVANEKAIADVAETASRNLYDKTLAVYGKYRSKGTEIKGAACYTGCIPVKPNTQYCVSVDQAVVDAIGFGFTTSVAQYDAESAYLGTASLSGSGSSACIPFITGADTYWVSVNFFMSQTFDEDIFATFVDSIVLEYGSCRSHEHAAYREDVASLPDGVLSFGGLALINRYKGKKWISCGTSITWYNAHTYSAGLHTGELCRGYQHYVCKALGLLLTNDGISGSTLGNKSSSSFINRYASIDWTAYDLVTIEYGVNDLGSVIPVGEATEDANTDTFAGCLKTVIEYIVAQNPTIRIVICTDPDVRGSANNANGNILADYADVTKEIAKQYRLPVCDWFYNSGISELTRGSSSLDYLTADGTHPNDAGHERMGYELIKTLLY